jgi:hypothetical protein
MQDLLYPVAHQKPLVVGVGMRTGAYGGEGFSVGVGVSIRVVLGLGVVVASLVSEIVLVLVLQLVLLVPVSVVGLLGAGVHEDADVCVGVGPLDL